MSTGIIIVHHSNYSSVNWGCLPNCRCSPTSGFWEAQFWTIASLSKWHLATTFWFIQSEKWNFSLSLTNLLEESLFNQYCNGFDACVCCDLVLRLYISIFHQCHLEQLLFFSPSPENCSQAYMLLISLTSSLLLLCFPALSWYLFTVNVNLSEKLLFCSSV